MILALFSDQYDFVVVDTPAASEVADAQIISARADGAIVLARRNHTRQALLRATMRNLTESGVNVIGSVLTEH